MGTCCTVLYRCRIGYVLCIGSLCMALIIISFVIYYLLVISFVICIIPLLSLFHYSIWIIPSSLNESILWKYPLDSLGFVYIRQTNSCLDISQIQVTVLYHIPLQYTKVGGLQTESSLDRGPMSCKSTFNLHVNKTVSFRTSY